MRQLNSLLVLLAASFASPAAFAEDSTEAVEFFEKQVRPILANRCFQCHGPEKQKSGLRLDSRASALKGGAFGPAVVPGKLEESLLVDAIRYGDLVQMPPKSKLPPAEIDVLTKWVAMGAPWPGGGAEAAVARAGAFQLQERAKHWSFQPIRVVEPPRVKDTSWPITPIDRFLLARLEDAGLEPAADTDRRTLLRRVTYDLIGLPPTPEEVRDFLEDESPGAFERVVDRLLASPQYGERWARHWLDLVRYAETAGHEFDYDIPNAWRYRDYLVRAFNADLPYDQLVLEHLAGDLLETPRRHPVEGFNESILGTGFYFLGEGTHSPLDLREEQVRRIDNQIDVLSKTFLGLTVACARCHDHKFDAITQADYYALAGFLKSSRHQQAFLDPPDRIVAKAEELASIKAAMIEETRGSMDLESLATQVAAYAEAAWRIAFGSDATKAEDRANAIQGLDEASLQRWLAALKDDGSRLPANPIAGLIAPEETARAGGGAVDGSLVFADFNTLGWGDWQATGDAFGMGPSRVGSGRVGPDGLVPVAPGEAHSGLISDRLQGVLRSPSFTIEKGFLLYRVHGRGGKINLVIDGFEKIRSPIYGGLTLTIDSERNRWYVQDVSMWVGHRAYVEIGDGATVDFTGGQSHVATGGGFIAVDEIRFADAGSVPASVSPLAVAVARSGEIGERARRFGLEVAAAFRDWNGGRADLSREEVQRLEDLGWLVSRGLVDFPNVSASRLDRYREIEAAIPEPTLATAIVDGTGEDECLLIRGNLATLGETVGRRFLEVFGGKEQTAPAVGSGRLALARRLMDSETDPLPSRVMVNRLWQHHFGRGIVPTPDDFGHMGRPPSHPDLLDFLARRFIAEGWSIKRMQRLMVLSHAYRMSSFPDPAAEQADPENRLLHRANVRRLEAEAIRDAMLAVSGRLESRLYGPSVPPHLTPFMDGRGRPAKSGPLDGDGRRSLYLNIRRNFLPPLLLVFDYPPPASTMGRRNVSNVPAQALALLNDPFVLEEARLWAESILALPELSPEARLDRMYRSAFGRPPTEAEQSEALAFLGEASPAGDVQAWADLAHVLFNSKEFLFID